MEVEEHHIAHEESVEETKILLEPKGDVGLKTATKMLIGRILSGKTLNRAAIKDVLNKAWGLLEDLNISDLGPNIFLFNFKEEREAKRVLEDGPWFVMGCLLSLQKWIPEVSVFEVDYAYVGFWVQLCGIPLELMNSSNAIRVAKFLGDMVTVENPFVNGQLLRSFMRVKVLINVKKPIIIGFWLPRKDLPRTWIFVKYERLQGFCFHSGILGHDYRKCNKEKEMAIHNPSKPGYGAGLVVPLAKSLVAIAAENSNRKKKFKEGVGSDMENGDRKEYSEQRAAATTRAQSSSVIGVGSSNSSGGHTEFCSLDKHNQLFFGQCY
ncbi:Zinc knuckle CX2CX4HX4C [Sesbania bispinosa]|nr:Zinc knuckle CX2CX4HX4C [Sesbania bispinosa]